MPNNIPNSTDYEHPNEPNLVNLHKAMEYNDNGEPHIRVKVDAGIVSVDEINLGIVEIANDEGNPIPTHTHLFDENEDEYSASNPFTVDGTVTIQDGGNSITVDGTVDINSMPAISIDSVSVDNFPATQTVDGTVNIGTMPEVEIKNDIGNPIPVIDSVQHQPSAFASFDNYDDKGNNRGWEFQDDWIPLFGLRVKPGSGTEFHLLDFSITLNGGNQVVAGYRWHMNPTLDAAYTWVDLGSTGVQYVKFEDIDGTPNEITSDTMVHSRALVGKTTDELKPEMKQFPFTDGGIEMFLEVRRLDGGATQDLFYHATMGID